jgi:hypothetical protein
MVVIKMQLLLNQQRTQALEAEAVVVRTNRVSKQQVRRDLAVLQTLALRVFGIIVAVVAVVLVLLVVQQMVEVVLPIL